MLKVTVPLCAQLLRKFPNLSIVDIVFVLYVHTCMYGYVPMYVHVASTRGCQVSSSITLCLSPFRQGLLVSSGNISVSAFP